MQQQVRSFVSGEAARKAQGQYVGIKEMPRLLHCFGWRAGGGKVTGQAFTRVINKRLAGGHAKLPKFGIRDAANFLCQVFHCPKPAFFAAHLGPKIVRRGGIPAWDVDSVGDVSDGHILLRPSRKERPKELPADFPMQAADAVDGPAAAQGQVSHVEILRGVVRILPAQGQQIVDGKAQLFPRVATKETFDKGGRETIKTGRHRRVGGEEVARPRGGQRDLERLPVLLHEIARAFQHGESRVPFVQVTDFGFEAQGGQQPPSAHAEQQFLLEAQLRPASVQLTGDSPVSGKVRGVVAIEQVKLRPADLNLPGAHPDGVTRQGDLQPQPLAVRLAHGCDGQLSGVVIGVEGLLRSITVNHLAKIASLVKQPHSDHRDAQVAGGFELVPGHVAQPAGVNGQRFAQHEFHAEIGDAT